ncbi:hypothetical protein EST92_15350 [Streptomyces sp. TM32]|uniref:hypothetical protein n=1 Tax=Streptomyces sp. TM32 TaxID=1652669 RepID=UPI00101181E0|nr:hypothetical protein [Streptomyces sp. TM32]RXS81883.1 hypothetical protein EST92_15350 [Streptomyces sp. TM32]
MRRFLTTEPANPYAASALVTVLLYACMLIVRLVLSASPFQSMDIAFIPAVFVLALAARLFTARRKGRV